MDGYQQIERPNVGNLGTYPRLTLRFYSRPVRWPGSLHRGAFDTGPSRRTHLLETIALSGRAVVSERRVETSISCLRLYAEAPSGYPLEGCPLFVCRCPPQMTDSRESIRIGFVGLEITCHGRMTRSAGVPRAGLAPEIQESPNEVHLDSHTREWEGRSKRSSAAARRGAQSNWHRHPPCHLLAARLSI